MELHKFYASALDGGFSAERHLSGAMSHIPGAPREIIPRGGHGERGGSGHPYPRYKTQPITRP